MSIFARRDPRDPEPALAQWEIAQRRANTACFEAGAEEAAMQAEYLWAVTTAPCSEQAADAWGRYSRACDTHQDRIDDMEATYR